jgi:hypothetical protein
LILETPQLETTGAFFVNAYLSKKNPTMNSQPPNPEGSIDVELSEDIAEGTYANLAMIAHSNSEFILDFIRLMPGVPKAKVKARIILTPEHAKRLLEALRENISRFEEANGGINDSNDGFRFPGGGYGGPVGQA